MAKKRVVVIGGSAGMGLGIAKLLFSLGYEVVIASRSKKKLEAARREIGNVSIRQLDFRNEGSLSRFFAKVGRFDHLVLPAADFLSAPFAKGAVKDARSYFDSKFWGQYCAAKYGAPKIRKGGSITFFSGAAYEKPLPDMAAVAAVNGAIQGLSKTLAVDLAPIRVNTVSPGLVDTPLWNVVPEKERAALFAESAKKLPARRIGQPEDIAQAVRFLIECGYATGTIVHVDGGFPLV